MFAASLAMIACLGWGTSGFLAGIQSRVMPVLTLVVFSSMATVGMFIIGIIVQGVPFPRDPNLLYAILGGAAGIGIYCFYRGLSVGAISIVVPISALGVMVPVVAGLIRGEVLHPVQGCGMLAAVSGSVLASLKKDAPEQGKKLSAGILPALGAALGFGVFYLVMDLAGSANPLWAAMVSRLSCFLFLFPVLLIKRPTLKVKASHLPMVIAIGVLEGMAAFSYTLATTKGMLSQVSVISSLYPAVSVILATLILKERLHRSQFLGVVLAIIGIVLLSSG